VSSPEPELPLLISRQQALASGIADRQVTRLAEGRWTRIRHGYLATVAELGAEQRWKAEVLAVQAAHRRRLVLAGAHAARAWGLPRPLSGWGPISFVSTVSPTRSRTGLVVRVAPLEDDDIDLVGPAIVTTVARTLADCGRLLPGRDGLAMADHALRMRLLTPAQLSEAVGRQKGWPGAVQARRVLELADGRRETALESWSAWAFAELGLPPPVWQVTLLDEHGVFLGRVDTWWEQGVAGEADGRGKYRLRAAERSEPDDEALEAVLLDQRLREMGLRRAGAGVIRWDARDVLQPSRIKLLGEHLHRELTETTHRFRGSVILG
jgi:hypothetical protein